MAKRNPSAEPTQLMTLHVASTETGVPYSSLYALVAKGDIPRVQLGDSRRIWLRRTDVERYLNSATVSQAR